MKLFTFLSSRRATCVLLLGAGVSMLSACSYTNGYEPPSPCSLPATVSYQTDVLPILTVNCRNACHNPTTAAFYANFNMDDVTQVQYWATHNLDKSATGPTQVSALVGNIRHDPGYNFMPQVGAKLSDCQIALIKAWVDAGARNN